MKDYRVEKILNRYAEIGGGAFKKIPEDIIRLDNVIKVLQEELDAERNKGTPDPNRLQVLRTRIVLKTRELDELARRKGI